MIAVILLVVLAWLFYVLFVRGALWILLMFGVALIAAAYLREHYETMRMTVMTVCGGTDLSFVPCAFLGRIDISLATILTSTICILAAGVIIDSSEKD